MVDEAREVGPIPSGGGIQKTPVDRAVKGARVGDVAPDFTLPDTQGELVSLRDLIRSGHVVLVFYRGDW